MTYHLDLKLSYACNNNCIHCVITDQRERVLGQRDFRSTAEVGRELVEAASRGFRLVTFTGGEPTLRKDLPLLVRAARSLGLTVGIQTNGRLLSDTKVRSALCGMGVRFVIAIHGPDAQTHDAITRVHGSFEQTSSAISALIREGERVTAKIVLSRLNMGSLPEFAVFLISLGVKRVNFTFPHGLGNVRRNYLAVVPKYSELMPYLMKAFDVLDADSIAYATEAIPLCLLGDRWEKASEIVYKGVLSEVRQLDQGPRNWSMDRVTEGKSKPDRCKGCHQFSLCEGVWSEYIMYFGDRELLFQQD